MFLCERRVKEEEFRPDKWRVFMRRRGKMVSLVAWIVGTMKEISFMLFVSLVFIDIYFVL